MLSCHGYSPNWLLFRKPKFSIYIEKILVAMEMATSKLIAQHLTVMYEARKVFIETEANEKLCRALKSKTRVTNSLMYVLGNCVYYKRETSDKWKGPGTVIGKENKHVLVVGLM